MFKWWMSVIEIDDYWGCSIGFYGGIRGIVVEE